jgi:hypothetical protein
MNWVTNLKAGVQKYLDDRKKRKQQEERSRQSKEQLAQRKTPAGRTDQVIDDLQSAGLTQDEIDRLQGKKKAVK